LESGGGQGVKAARALVLLGGHGRVGVAVVADRVGRVVQQSPSAPPSLGLEAVAAVARGCPSLAAEVKRVFACEDARAVSGGRRRRRALAIATTTVHVRHQQGAPALAQDRRVDRTAHQRVVVKVKGV
jgi:hypothetical protein